jgi:hypothetical protein
MLPIWLLDTDRIIGMEDGLSIVCGDHPTRLEVEGVQAVVAGCSWPEMVAFKLFHACSDGQLGVPGFVLQFEVWNVAWAELSNPNERGMRHK